MFVNAVDCRFLTLTCVSIEYYTIKRIHQLVHEWEHPGGHVPHDAGPKQHVCDEPIAIRLVQGDFDIMCCRVHPFGNGRELLALEQDYSPRSCESVQLECLE